MADVAKSIATAIETDYSKTFTDSAGNVTKYVTAKITTGTATGSQHSLSLVSNSDPVLAGGKIGLAPGLDTGNKAYISDATLTPSGNMTVERTRK